MEFLDSVLSKVNRQLNSKGGKVAVGRANQPGRAN